MFVDQLLGNFDFDSQSISTVFRIKQKMFLIEENGFFVEKSGKKYVAMKKKSFYLFVNIKAVKFQEDYLDWKLDKFDLYKKQQVLKFIKLKIPSYDINLHS